MEGCEEHERQQAVSSVKRYTASNLVRPPVLPDELDEPAPAERLLSHALACFRIPFQILDALVPHGDEEPAAIPELLDEGFRYMRGTCGDDEAVVWCILGQALSAVTDADMDVEVTEIVEGLPGPGCQGADALYGIDRGT